MIIIRQELEIQDIISCRYCSVRKIFTDFFIPIKKKRSAITRWQIKKTMGCMVQILHQDGIKMIVL